MDENTLQNTEQPNETQSQNKFDDIGFGVDNSKMIETLLNRNHIPLHIQNKLWSMMGRNAILTFLTDEDVKTLNLNWQLERMTLIESVTKSAYNEEFEEMLNQIENEIFLTIRRSRGNRQNERELLGMSTQMTFTDKGIGNTNNEKGFLDKLASMFK